MSCECGYDETFPRCQKCPDKGEYHDCSNCSVFWVHQSREEDYDDLCEIEDDIQ